MFEVFQEIPILFKENNYQLHEALECKRHLYFQAFSKYRQALKQFQHEKPGGYYLRSSTYRHTRTCHKVTASSHCSIHRVTPVKSEWRGRILNLFIDPSALCLHRLQVGCCTSLLVMGVSARK